MKNYNVLTFLFVTFCLIRLSAQNLVINPSFENVTACPLGIGEFYRATDWDDINSGADSCSSPDLIAGCAPGIGGANSPNMLLGYQASRTGNNHAGIILYEGFALTGCTPLFSDNYREYIGGSLSTPLVAGQTYCVSFYISLADNVKWGVNSIGVYFSNGPYQHNFCTSGSPAPVTPQLQYSGGVLSDTTNWVRLQWNYTASGGETHFVIGNFNNDASTVRGDVNCSAFNPYAYYFIDDVSVEAGACTINCPTITVSGIINDVSCGSSNNGSIDITPTGGASPYTYQWSNASTAEDLSSLIAGSYSVTVTDNNACTGTFVGSVGSSPGLSLNSNPTNVSCSGGNDGAAAVLVSGAPGPYTFSWSTGLTTSQITGLSAGVYNVTVSTSGSGSTTDTLYQQDFSGAHGWTLNVATGINSATPNAWFVNAEEGGGILPPGCGVANNGNNSLHISCTSFGCDPPFNLLTGAVYDATQQTNRRAESPVFSTVGYTGITLNFNYISLGDALLDNASVLYNDGGGWQVLDPSIKSPVCGSGQGQWTAFSAVLPASCDNNPNVQVAINWTNNNDNIGTDPSIAVDNFAVTSLGTGGTVCSGVQSVTITEPSALNVSTSVFDASCGQNNGSVNLTVTGGNAGYDYIWSNGASTQNISGLTAGNYDVTVSDANNCTISASSTLTTSSSISLTTIVTNSSCGGADGGINIVVFGGSSPYSFNWSNGASSQNLAGLSAGSYTVTVSDATLCTTVSTIVVNSASTSTVTLDSVVNLNCNGDNNGSIYISAISGPTACSSATVVINEVMYRPSTFDGNSADPLLTGEYIELIGPPGTDISCYVLSDGDWAITIPPGTIIPADGIYTLGHNSSPYAIANGITYDLDVANCGCFTAGTSGNGILIFTNGGEYVGLYDNSGSFLDGLLYGTPSAGNTPPSGAITSGGVINTIGLVGCPATINIATTGYQTHPGGVVGGTSLVRIPDGAGGTWSTQVGGSANLCNSSASSNFTYLWSNGASTEDVSGLSAGVYSVTVTDPLGCDNIITATVTEPSALVTNTISITDANCSAPGAIDINVSGGTPIYSFVWSNGVTTEDLSGLSAGSYDVTITDVNGCTVTNLANTVNSSGIPIINIQSTTASSCNGTSDGAADISISDGTPVYSFVWSNGSTTEDLNNVSSGSYTVTVTDALGCIDSLSVTINEPSVIISAVSITEVNCSDANGAIEFAVGGGNGGFTFIWNTGSSDQNISGLSSGNYSVTATDVNGCEVIQNFTISAPYQPSLSAFIGQAGIVDSTILLGESIIVNVGNDETANGVSYQWSSIPNTANFVDVNSVSTEVTPDPSGDYLILITATSIDGCSDTDTLQLTVNPLDDPRIPTAFSPNGDNLNDIFKVVDLDVTYLKEFKVFSRWGQLVCDNLNGQWDGTFNGAEQPRDVYIYIISWQRPNDPDPVVNRGNVTLLR